VRFGALLAATAALLVAPAASGASAGFRVSTSPYTLGQAATWLDDGHVVFSAKTADGDTQIFRSTLPGKHRRCLSCGLNGPNQVPVPEPHGDWILFHSWHGHSVRVGSPGFGGLGSDVWVMTRDGRHRTNLTKTGELHDNFHAYWSPDGRYIAWTALDWNSADGGNGKSDVRVGRFEPDARGGPRLADVHTVRPGNGHWYETQWWAPDGSGFLYTETYDTALNPELFFCRLPDPARGACRPQRLTRNPAWDEQAVFTPDMSRIVFMSTRDHAGAFNNWSQLATLLKLPASYDYAIILPVFSESFLQPVFQQADDLYAIDLRWNASHTRFRQRGPVRRLTRSGGAGWVIPEFAWDPSGTRLLWTQSRIRGRVDEPTILRQIRDQIVSELSQVHTVGQIPVDIFGQVRNDVGQVLQNPSAFAPSGPTVVQSETVIGRLAG
jgi:WD40-like Beta Propeller Repeat